MKHPIVISSRRSFLKHAFTGAAAAGVAAPWLLRKHAWGQLKERGIVSAASPGFSGRRTLKDDPRAPIAWVSDPRDQKDFNGDDISRPHDILWDKDGYLKSKGGIPAVSERWPVVIVGGGISGLSAAYRLRDLKPLLLEAAPRFGGNSKGESWGDATYSLGAAYITTPDAGTPTHQILDELDLLKTAREEKGEEMAVQRGAQFQSSFWQGATDPAHASEFKRVWDAFAKVRDDVFPDIPYHEGGQLTPSQFHALDAQTFSEWISAQLGPIHPHIDEFLQEYCWSSFGGECSELSAAQALNFLTGDLGGTIALPGGNSAVAQSLYDKIALTAQPDALRSDTFVVDITPNDEGVRICYESADRKLVTIQAKTCVVTSPKFASRYMVNGLPEDQAYAMTHLKYRAYIVANVLLKGRCPSPGFDLFRLTGQVPSDARAETQTRPFTDLCFGNWAGNDQAENSVLTLYKALPYDGARQFLFSPLSYGKYQVQMESELPALCKALGISADRVQATRLTRWGHSIPLAQAGLFESGRLKLAAQPLGGRIFFGQQDNWANPCFETALGAGLSAADDARKALVSL